MKELFDLFIVFARIGGLTFGGGYAMLPLLQKEVVESRHWATEDELMDYYAIGQCTPGIIAVNTATFIGYKTKGILGGILATLGVVFPSIIIISVIYFFLRNFADIAAVQHAFAGIRVCICMLILSAVIKLAKKSIKDKWTFIIFLIIFAASLFTKLSPIILVITAGVLGIIFSTVKAKNSASSFNDKKENKEADK